MLTRYDAADAHWRVAPLPGLSPDQKDWLTRGGSLTAHLRTLGAVTVRVTNEAVALPWDDEYAALGLALRTPVWVREVVLSVDNTPFVAAHSIVPLAPSKGVWQAMRRLRTRPLAELLYSDSSVSRSSLVSRRLTARHPLYRLATRERDDRSAHALVARRSVFERHGAPLMVTECMLPALWTRLATREARPAAPHPVPRDHGQALDHTASRAHPAARSDAHVAHVTHATHATHGAKR